MTTKLWYFSSNVFGNRNPKLHYNLMRSLSVAVYALKPRTGEAETGRSHWVEDQSYLQSEFQTIRTTFWNPISKKRKKKKAHGNPIICVSVTVGNMSMRHMGIGCAVDTRHIGEFHVITVFWGFCLLALEWHWCLPPPFSLSCIVLNTDLPSGRGYVPWNMIEEGHSGREVIAKT